jgi:hypothetical protein
VRKCRQLVLACLGTMRCLNFAGEFVAIGRVNYHYHNSINCLKRNLQKHGFYIIIEMTSKRQAKPLLRTIETFPSVIFSAMSFSIVSLIHSPPFISIADIASSYSLKISSTSLVRSPQYGPNPL